MTGSVAERVLLLNAVVRHPLPAEDADAAEAARAAALPRKGRIRDQTARAVFDAMMAAVPGPDDMTYEEGVLGGVPGWWCRPAKTIAGRRLLFLHGGGYALGSALAFRGFAGQFASLAQADAFLPDYRRAPEHPFPAAVEDALAAFNGLAELSDSIGLIGDSAGGGLVLSILSQLVADGRSDRIRCAAVMSPWTDLCLEGPTLATRAEADPVFTPDALANVARLYLRGHDPRDPRASPLYANLCGLPPVRVDVGDDEILLSDAERYVEAACAQGSSAALHVWLGMSHVPPSKIDRFSASRAAVAQIGAFLAEHLQGVESRR